MSYDSERIVFINGDRIFLSPLELHDAKTSYPHWLNDALVSLGNSHNVFPYTREQAEEYITSRNNDLINITLAIFYKNDACHIGNISLQSINYINRSAEFAILIGEKDYWGKGIGKEATLLMLKHAFMQMNLHRVYCGTFATNMSMISLARSVGMKQEGVNRQAVFKNASYHDVIQFSILEVEFLEQIDRGTL